MGQGDPRRLYSPDMHVAGRSPSSLLTLPAYGREIPVVFTHLPHMGQRDPCVLIFGVVDDRDRVVAAGIWGVNTCGDCSPYISLRQGNR